MVTKMVKCRCTRSTLSKALHLGKIRFLWLCIQMSTTPSLLHLLLSSMKSTKRRMILSKLFIVYINKQSLCNFMFLYHMYTHFWKQLIKPKNMNQSRILWFMFFGLIKCIIIWIWFDFFYIDFDLKCFSS